MSDLYPVPADNGFLMMHVWHAAGFAVVTFSSSAVGVILMNLLGITFPIGAVFGGLGYTAYSYWVHTLKKKAGLR